MRTVAFYPFVFKFHVFVLRWTPQPKQNIFKWSPKSSEFFPSTKIRNYKNGHVRWELQSWFEIDEFLGGTRLGCLQDVRGLFSYQNLGKRFPIWPVFFVPNWGCPPTRSGRNVGQYWACRQPSGWNSISIFPGKSGQHHHPNHFISSLDLACLMIVYAFYHDKSSWKLSPWISFSLAYVWFHKMNHFMFSFLSIYGCFQK